MKRISLFATALAFFVILLGGYTRLKNAGLGCPDWPGCYGHVSVPTEEKALEAHPSSPLVAHKAWIEMTHRYVAGVLALSILVLFVLALRSKNISLIIPSSLLMCVVIFQAMLGMWTVTLKLHPFVVMSHLLGGLTTFGLLVWIYCRGGPMCPPSVGQTHGSAPTNRHFIIIGLVLLILQIALGGWTSSNYASLACPDFPTCQSHIIPPLDMGSAFNVWRDWGENHEGGLLHNEARMTIHWVHRVFAILVFSYLVFLFFKFRKIKGLEKNSFILLCLGFFQVLLGISNVVFHLPLFIAVSHLGGAAFLLATMVSFVFKTRNHD